MKVLIIILLMCTSCNINTAPGKGQKLGRIVKLEKRGLINETWEGELIRGGITDGTGSMGSSFSFTIEDMHNLDTAKLAFSEQREVILTYRIEFICKAWRSDCSLPRFVENIEFSK